ncbi:hypothetical protein LJB88_00250 [Erysipelotrichaceae bacterium OttesenSCG-928-M19]|nr:hypothetical protein [Erysipelotrichaceae bacterium OttesenSCG-928-M19]
MNIYYDKVALRVKIISFFAKLFLLIAFLGALVFSLQHFNILNYYTSYNSLIKYVAITIFVIALVLFIIKKLVNRRKNVRFDGEVIKFCVNNYVEHEFALKQIDEMFNYRSIPEITYGMQDALAFRFHKNETWETITSTLKNPKTKESSIVLIKDINTAYAKIKSQRAVGKMTSSQGVRFRYLSLGKDKEYTIDDYNAALKKFEATFKDYNNTYGDFEIDRLVITNDSLYHNKYRVASINDGDYIKVRMAHDANDKYYISEYIDFYNNHNDLVLTIDLTLVVNAELFKTLCLSVFTVQK